MALSKFIIPSLIAGLCMTTFVESSYAQTSDRHLSFKEALSLGLDNSKSLKVDDAKLQAAIANIEVAKNNQLPDASASASYLRINNPNVSLKFLESGSGNANDGSTTTTYSTPKLGQAMYGMVSGSLPLFAGGTIKNGIKSAQYLKNATEFDAARDKDQIALNVASAYYNLYKAQAMVRLIQQNLVTAKQRVVDFKNLMNNSLIAKNDLMKVELQESNVELTLLDAEKQEKVANYNFNLLLGTNTATKIEVDPVDLSTVPSINDMDSLESYALQNRADLNALGERYKAALTAIDIEKGKRLPTIGLSAGYLAMDVPHAISITNAVNAGIGVKYDIGSLYKSKSKIKLAQAQANQLLWSKANLEDGVRSQVYGSIQEYVQSLKKIKVLQNAIDQADENYRVTKSKYDNSLATTTDLLDADVAKLKANIDYENGKADAMIAYNGIFEAAGNIIQVNDIQPKAE